MQAATSESSVARRVLLRRSRLSSLGDSVFRWAVAVFGLSMIALAAVVVYQLVAGSRLSIQEFGLGFLTETAWNPVTSVFGAWPAIYGTVVSSLLAIVLAVPISLGAAIYLSEMAPSWLRNPVSFLVESLAAIPSVVYGLWALYVLVPWIQSPVETWLGGHFSWLPLFSGPPYGVGMLAAGVVLAIMILPIVTAISRDSMMAVPTSQREAMLALGATKWETIRGGVLHYCRSGLVAAILLGLGRALGETIAVTMVIGKTYDVDVSLFKPAATAASQIASEFGEASDSLWRSSLIELALILFGITLLVNIAARVLVWRLAQIPERLNE